MARKKATGCVATARVAANPHIFAPDTGPGGPVDPCSQPIDLPNVKTLVQCAAQGCQVCRILTGNRPKTSFSDVNLGRGTQLWRQKEYHRESKTWSARSGMGTLNLEIKNGGSMKGAVFVVVPPEWLTLPRAQLGQPPSHVDLARTWLAQCREHDACRAVRGSGYVPARLLDLGGGASEVSSDLRLVDTRTSPLGGAGVAIDYVALSHCWGPPESQPIQTTKNALPVFLDSIAFGSLPLSFREAVQFCRELGYRYLWIDSLCIVQDDRNDWAREACRMADVYENAVCTLAATSAQDSTQGCRLSANRQANGLRPAFRDAREYFDLDIGDDRRVRILKDTPKAWAEELGDRPTAESSEGTFLNPLRWRAWALQERELSVRMIHFSENMLLWECRTLKASCELPWDERPSYREAQYPTAPIPNAPAEPTGPGSASQRRDGWFTIVEDFSARGLTREGDKFPALAGLASRFQRHVPESEYLFGLWSEHLPSALLWKAFSTSSTRPVRRPGVARAPTWSWASLEGGVAYHSQRAHAPGSSLGRKPHDAEGPDEHKWFARVLSWRLDSGPSGSYMGAEQGRITLRGLLVALGVGERAIKDAPSRGDFGSALLDKDGTIVGTIFHDIPHEVSAGQRVFCIAIRSEPQDAYDQEPREWPDEPHCPPPVTSHGLVEVAPVLYVPDTSPKVMGLALVEEVGGGEGVFRRVGVVRWLRESALSEAKEATVLLV